MSFSLSFEDLRRQQVQSWVILSATVLPLYEYVITFEDEIRAVWRRRLTASSVLLLTTRWVMVLIAVLQFVTPTPQRLVALKKERAARCRSLSLTESILTCVGLLQSAAFSALRVFAISERNHPLTLIVLALSLVPVATNLFGISRAHYCAAGLPESTWIDISPKENEIFLFVTRSSAVAGDILVLFVTWLMTFRQWKEARALHLRLSISTCLLRDGTVYFILMTVISAVHMATYRVTFQPLSPIITVLPSLLVNRFLINLRQVDNSNSTTEGEGSLHYSRISLHNLHLQTVVGNIGEPLDDGSGGVVGCSDEKESHSRLAGDRSAPP